MIHTALLLSTNTQACASLVPKFNAPIPQEKTNQLPTPTFLLRRRGTFLLQAHSQDQASSPSPAASTTLDHTLTTPPFPLAPKATLRDETAPGSGGHQHSRLGPAQVQEGNSTRDDERRCFAIRRRTVSSIRNDSASSTPQPPVRLPRRAGEINSPGLVVHDHGFIPDPSAPSQNPRQLAATALNATSVTNDNERFVLMSALGLKRHQLLQYLDPAAVAILPRQAGLSADYSIDGVRGGQRKGTAEAARRRTPRNVEKRPDQPREDAARFPVSAALGEMEGYQIYRHP
ncbi:hypothetical protein FRC01_001905 [Tulasnella sp. 417]|nr:hypothetical protein FRC01_001905 [Tulasnella sp. 417]